MATTPDAPPAMSAKAPVTGETSARTASSRPATRLTRMVPSVTPTIGSRARPIEASDERLTSEPMVTPISACPRRKAARHLQLRRRGQGVGHPTQQRAEQHGRGNVQQAEDDAEHDRRAEHEDRGRAAGSEAWPTSRIEPMGTACCTFREWLP